MNDFSQLSAESEMDRLAQVQPNELPPEGGEQAEGLTA
jgi:hypothetical protein